MASVIYEALCTTLSEHLEGHRQSSLELGVGCKCLPLHDGTVVTVFPAN